MSDASWAGITGTILGVISTGLGIYITFTTDDLKKTSIRQDIEIQRQKQQVDLADLEIRRNSDLRANTIADRDYFVKVYDKVVNSLSGTDKKAQELALALVETISDPILRSGLAGAFKVSPDESLRNQAVIIRDQAVAVQGNPKGWDYDIFWCQANPNNEGVAAKVLASLQSPDAGRIRLRPWSVSENSQPAYNARGLEIRAEDSEYDQAKKIKSLIDSKVGTSFLIKKINTRTAWYISIFVCD